MPKRDLSQADAAELVLQSAGRPMHRNDITDGIIKAGFEVWGKGGPGRTPEESVGRAITQDILRKGADSRFEYFKGKGSGMFRLRQRTTGGEGPGIHRNEHAERESAFGHKSALAGGLARLREPRYAETLEDLIEDVSRHGLEPVPFICSVTHEAIRKLELQRLEREHEEGYRRVPVQPDEFGGDEDSTMWDEL